MKFYFLFKNWCCFLLYGKNAVKNWIFVGYFCEFLSEHSTSFPRETPSDVFQDFQSELRRDGFQDIYQDTFRDFYQNSLYVSHHDFFFCRFPSGCFLWKSPEHPSESYQNTCKIFWYGSWQHPDKRPGETPGENSRKKSCNKFSRISGRRLTRIFSRSPAKFTAENPAEYPAENPGEILAETPHEIPGKTPSQIPTENAALKILVQILEIIVN